MEEVQSEFNSRTEQFGWSDRNRLARDLNTLDSVYSLYRSFHERSSASSGTYGENSTDEAAEMRPKREFNPGWAKGGKERYAARDRRELP